MATLTEAPGPKELFELVQNREDKETMEKFRQSGGSEGLAARLKVNPTQGMKSEDVEANRARYGENRIPDRPTKTFFQLFLMAFQDITMYMLIAACVLSFVLWAALEQGHGDGYIEAVAIFITIIMVTTVNAGSDYKKEKEFRKLNDSVEDVRVSVLRDNGTPMEISIYDLVVGDVVRLKVGDILPADGPLLEGHGVECDESALTGEPNLIKKNVDSKPIMISGTSVQKGQGIYLVTGVGYNSENGRIQALIRGYKIPSLGEDSAKEDKEGKGRTPEDELLDLDEAKKPGEDQEEVEEEDSPLVAKLNVVATLIGYMALAIALVTFLGMAIRFCIVEYGILEREFSTKFWLEGREWLIITITIVVVAVPEGLPLAVTLSLALSVSKMQKDQNLVRQLGAAETMGSATTICSDKTGTLTQNKMTVVRGYANKRHFGQAKDHSVGQEMLQELGSGTSSASSHVHLIAEGLCLNKADSEITWDDKIQNWIQDGNKTDCAALAFAMALGYDYREVRKEEKYFSTRDGRKQFGVRTLAFSSERKRAGIAISLGDNKYRLYMKGASEIMLNLCGSQMTSEGNVPLDKAGREDIKTNVIDAYAKGALRTIGLAYKDFDHEPDWEAELDEATAIQLTGQNSGCYKVETGLIFIGLLGIADPLRDSVKKAIEDCNNAGIHVIMVTGDLKATAIAIAMECNILKKGVDVDDDGNLLHEFTAMTGAEFRKSIMDKHGNIDMKKFDERWPVLRVLARSSPEDKFTLVNGMMTSNLFSSPRAKVVGVYPDRQVVAVTGDGTNDAPALKRADVGFAMGIAGTGVAKDAADIIILDDNFSSIVKAVLWGRNIFDSIAKFLQFQLIINVVAVLNTVIGAFASGQSPMTAVQLLWINVIMDTLAALGMASDPPVPELLKRKPYGRNRFILSRHNMVNIAGHSLFQLTLLMILMFTSAGPIEGDMIKADDFPPGGFMNFTNGFRRPNTESEKKECRDLFPNDVAQQAAQCDLFDYPTVHLSFIFNTFVMLQLFNWINCRKLWHEINVFKGIQNNLTFCIIWIICMAIQVFIIEFQTIVQSETPTKINIAFGTHSLTPEQWGISLGFGASSLLVQFVISIFSKLFLKKWLSFDHELIYTIKEQETQDLEAAPATGGGEIRGFLSGVSAKSTDSRHSTGSRILDGKLQTGRVRHASKHFTELGGVRRGASKPLEPIPGGDLLTQEPEGEPVLDKVVRESKSLYSL